MKTTVLLSVATLAAAFTMTPEDARAQTSAWTREPGELQVIAQGSWVRAGELYGFDGQVSDYDATLPGEEAFQDTSLYLSVELGLLRGLTLSVTVPYKLIQVEDASFDSRTGAVGDSVIGLRLGVLELAKVDQPPLAVAIEYRVKLPSGYTRNLRPSAGPGQVDFELHLAAGTSIPVPGFPLYTQASIGYRLRSGIFFGSSTKDCPEQGSPGANCFQETNEPNFGDEIAWSGELGTTPLEGKIVAFAKVFGAFSIEAPDRGFDPTNPIPDRQRFIKVGGGAIIYPVRFLTEKFPVLRDLGLLVQSFTTPDGQNTIRSDDLFGGFIYRADVY